jgi:hypothetical protein
MRVPVSEQKSSFKNTYLQDDHIFGNYNIEKSSILDLLVAPPNMTVNVRMSGKKVLFEVNGFDCIECGGKDRKDRK